MGGLKFDHAGTPEPGPLPVASTSSVEPLGSAGLVNQGTTGTVEQVGPGYSDLAQATRQAALNKRETEWHSLMGGHASSSGSMGEGY